MIVSIFW